MCENLKMIEITKIAVSALEHAVGVSTSDGDFRRVRCNEFMQNNEDYRLEIASFHCQYARREDMRRLISSSMNFCTRAEEFLIHSMAQIRW